MGERRLPKVAFLYLKGRVARLADVESGVAPTEFFYGAVEMQKRGYDVALHEVDWIATGNFAERVIGRLWPATARPVKMDPAMLVQVWRLARELNAADCIVATGGNIAFALAALARIGVIRKPIIGIQCGVLNFRHGFWRRRLSSALLKRMHTQLFGGAELGPMRSFFDLPAEVIDVNLFGVDTGFWRPDPDVQRDIVLSIGNDGRRDFAILVAAAEHIPAPVHIVTKLPLPEVLPSNVTHHRGSWHGSELSDARIRELYQRARVVVVPLRPSNQPSGQSVTLQAMACGAPVVLTETEGLWSREQMTEGRNVVFARAGDSEHLAERVRELLGDDAKSAQLSREGRSTVEQSGSIELFADRIASCCERILSARGISRTAE
jgi:glycosyltransferase involved in cell wall biosynthesis